MSCVLLWKQKACSYICVRVCVCVCQCSLMMFAHSLSCDYISARNAPAVTRFPSVSVAVLYTCRAATRACQPTSFGLRSNGKHRRLSTKKGKIAKTVDFERKERLPTITSGDRSFPNTPNSSLQNTTANGANSAIRTQSQQINVDELNERARRTV